MGICNEEEEGSLWHLNFFLNVLGLADRIGCPIVSTLSVCNPSLLSQEPPCKQPTLVTRQVWGLNVSVPHFAEIICQTVYGIVA